MFLVIIMAVALVPFAVVGLPIWIFGQRRVSWTIWDFLVPVLPFLIWWGLAILNHFNKSLSNLIELFYIGLIILLSPIVRLIVGKRELQFNLAISLLISRR